MNPWRPARTILLCPVWRLDILPRFLIILLFTMATIPEFIEVGGLKNVVAIIPVYLNFSVATAHSNCFWRDFVAFMSILTMFAERIARLLMRHCPGLLDAPVLDLSHPAEPSLAPPVQAHLIDGKVYIYIHAVLFSLSLALSTFYDQLQKKHYEKLDWSMSNCTMFILNTMRI